MTKTFDQKLAEKSPEEMLSPNVAWPANAVKTYLVAEPVEHQGVVRVSLSARDDQMRVLWRTMVSEPMLQPGETTPVAIYSQGREMVRQHLKDRRPRHEHSDNPYDSISKSAKEITALVELSKRKTVAILNKSSVTDDRASLVADALRDCQHALLFALSQVGICSGNTGSEEAE